MLADIAVYSSAQYGQGSEVVVFHPHCNGGESGLQECSITHFPDCSSDLDAAIDCTPCMSALFTKLSNSIAEFVNEYCWHVI